MKKINLMFVCKMDDYLMKALKKLNGSGVHLAYATIEDKYEEQLNQDFEGAKPVFIKNLDNPEFYASENRKSPFMLTKQIIKDMQDCEQIFMAVSDRFTFFNISARERKQIYFDMLLYWYTFLKQNPIDCLMYYSSPQMAGDIVLYFVAKYLGIRTLTMERTCIDNATLFLEDFRQLEEVPDDYLSGKTEDELIQMLGENFYNDVMKESFWVKFSKEKMKNMQADKGIGHAIIRNMKKFFAFFKFYEYVSDSAFYFNMSRIRKSHFLYRYALKKIRDRGIYRHYRSFVEPVDYKAPYIYFPLQFQPERTSVPMAGVFENQILALEILSKALPEGWKILIKDHPRQLKVPRMSCIHYRTKKYYDRIKSIKGVSFVDIDEKSSELIRHCKMAVTLTGTTGWEAMVNAKECLVFGHAWYVGSRNCYMIDSVETARKAIETSQAKSDMDIKLDFLKFLVYYKDKFFHTVHRHGFAIRSSEDYDVLLNNLTEAIQTKVLEKDAVLQVG